MLYSEKYSSIGESSTLAITKLCRSRQQMGEKIIELTLGEPNYDTPQYIKQICCDALQDGYTHYTPVAGLLEAQIALSKKMKKYNEAFYKPEEIIISNGAKQCLYNVFNAALNPGDEVILFVPCRVSYRDMLKLINVKIIPLEASEENGFKISADELQNNITENTRMIIMTNPQNPSGIIYDYNDLKALVNVIKKYPLIWYVSDEMYEFMVYEKKYTSIACFGEILDQCVIINGMSKAFAMTGRRIGYMAIKDKKLRYLCELVQEKVTSGANAFVQKTLVGIIEHNMHDVYDMCKEYKIRRDLVCDVLDKIPGLKYIKPDAGFYIYPNVKYFFGKKTPGGEIINDSLMLVYYLLDCGVAVLPGTPFGTNEHIRISYSYQYSDVYTGMKIIQNALDNLQ